LETFTGPRISRRDTDEELATTAEEELATDDDDALCEEELAATGATAESADAAMP